MIDRRRAAIGAAIAVAVAVLGVLAVTVGARLVVAAAARSAGFSLSSFDLDLGLGAITVRNVRGSLATAGGYEEVLLDDGDMNMFRILLELRRVGFEGCVNADHIPPIEGDTPGSSLGLAYSIGYLRSMLAALAALS